MKKINLTCEVTIYENLTELLPEDQELIKAAIEATKRSYAPYSNFSVGAAVRLKDGQIITGTNQENAAYPSGICAERTTLFYAGSQYPQIPVTTLAIAAHNGKELTDQPISPCGACRQVILEAEERHQQQIRIILYGTKGIYSVETVRDLLPFSFVAEAMKSK